MKKSISFGESQIIEFLSVLEYMVGSLDRIGSADLSEDARRLEVYNFIVKGDVFERVASIRKTIWTTIDEHASPEEVEALEATIEKIEVWKLGGNPSS